MIRFPSVALLSQASKPEKLPVVSDFHSSVSRDVCSSALSLLRKLMGMALLIELPVNFADPSQITSRKLPLYSAPSQITRMRAPKIAPLLL